MVLFLHEGAELYVAAVDEEDRLNLDGIRISEHDGVAGNVACERALCVNG